MDVIEEGIMFLTLQCSKKSAFVKGTSTISSDRVYEKGEKKKIRQVQSLLPQHPVR